MRVLLVDDAAVLRAVLGGMLAGMGHAVVGEAALQEVRLVTAATAAGVRGALRRPALASEVREALVRLARTDERRSER